MSLLQALKLPSPPGLAGGAPPVSPAEAAWKSRAAAFETAAEQVATIEKAGDPRGAVLRQVVDRIAEQVERRQFAPSSVALDQLLPKLKPIHE